MWLDDGMNTTNETEINNPTSEIREIENLILDAARHWRFHPGSGSEATLKMLVDRLDAAENTRNR